MMNAIKDWKALVILNSGRPSLWFCVLLTIAVGRIMPAEGSEASFALALQDQTRAPAEPLPSTADEVGQDEVPVPPLNPPSLSNDRFRGRQSLGVVAASRSAAPAMIGDFFGGTFLHVSTAGQTVAVAGGDRRFKVAENVSPIPQDRVYFNFNHFENSLIDPNNDRRSLNRFALGFEKTFCCGEASIEVRLPISRGLDSNQAFNNPDPVATEIGNVGLALKTSLMSGCNWILTGGASMTLPTGDDFKFYDYPYEPRNLDLLIENDAVHLAPFLGWFMQPNERYFAQGFLQVDIDLNGNDVFSSSGFEGVLQDQNLLFFDLSVGRWIYESQDRCARLSGVAAITEVHYTGTLNDTDYVSYGLQPTQPYGRTECVGGASLSDVPQFVSSGRRGAADR